VPAELPSLVVNHPFYRDLVASRATLVGLGTDDRLDVADALVVSAARLWNAATFACEPRAKMISRVGVGYDNVVAAHALGMQVIVSDPAVTESPVPSVELVDHDPLPTAIDNGHLGGAGLDVTDPEPLQLGHPLLDRLNVVVTPIARPPALQAGDASTSIRSTTRWRYSLANQLTSSS
jgi:phosphoglycerate dehydrogenase-like enzyme